MNTRLRLTALAAVFAVLTPATTALHARVLGPEGIEVPDGTRKCIKWENRVPVPPDGFVPLACTAPVVNASATAGNQDESFLVVNPTNTNNLVAFANTTSNSIFRAFSMNGGATWTRGTIATGVACCDAQAAFDTFGNLFLVYINASVNQINVILSTDGGVTFSAPLTVGTGSIDQPSIAVGNGSVWVDWNQSGSMVARGAPVTGLGVWGPFNAQQAIPSATGSFGGIAVGPGPNGGKVIVTYQSPTGGQGPATIYANVDADGLGAGGFGARITVSATNVGGFDFIPAQNERSIDAEAGVVWDATGGPFNNRIYLVYTDETVNENNDTDILVRTSTDDGATWSAPVRVNDDATTRSQFLPYITLDRTTGTVAVGFHDCRNDTGVPGVGGTNAVPNDDAEYFGTFSINGGVTWAPNTRLSGGFSNAAAAAAPVDYGDYVGQDAYAGKLYTVWSDNSNCDGTNPNGTLSAFDLYMNTLTIFSATPTPTPTISPGITPTPPPTPTPTPTPTPSPTPTPTPTVTPCGVSTFSNPAPITLPDCPTGCAAPQPASTYPSNITVAGVSGSVAKVTVTIAGWNHTFPGDNDFLLVGPGGQKFIVLSDALTGADTTGQTYTFDDGAAALMDSAPATAPPSGSFRPTNYTAGDTFPAPAPAAPYLSPATAGTDTLAAFNGANPNGVWSLYIVDDANIDSGTITGGWSLSITTNAGCGTPTPTPTPTPTASATATPATPTPTPPTPTPTLSPGITPTPPPPTPTPTLSPGITPTPPPPTPTPTLSPGLTPTPTPSATPTATPIAAAQAVNLSTRMNVRTGDNVGIGGFIIQGTAPKHVLLRAIGPSITGLPGVLADPVLELHGPAGFTTVTDNNWQDDPAQAALIQASGLAPTNPLESAIDATLAPGAYTGVVKGNGGTTGIGLVEVYDLSQAVLSKLGNISTRALVGTGNDIVIAGFILGNNSGGTRIVVRGIGGSLSVFGVPNPLANPTLELRDNNAAILASNDNWQDDASQAAELTAAGLAPTNANESGIAITLGPGQYTALLSGVGNTTGVGVVEVYDRGAP